MEKKRTGYSHCMAKSSLNQLDVNRFVFVNRNQQDTAVYNNEFFR